MNLSIGGFKIRLEILLLVAVIVFIICAQTTLSCCSSCEKGKEGFSSAGAKINTNNYQSYSLEHDAPVDTSKWGMPSLVVKSGEAPGPGVNAILNRPTQQVPLPEGQLSMFANTEFKPECCPNAYSNGSGCACMTVNQYNYLVSRGGNNVPYSEY
jgi:hypothetical protein